VRLHFRSATYFLSSFVGVLLAADYSYFKLYLKLLSSYLYYDFYLLLKKEFEITGCSTVDVYFLVQSSMKK